MEIRRTPEFDRRLKRLTDTVAQSRIALTMQRMEDGNLGDSKSVGGGVIEARIHYGPGYRVYYTRRGAEIIVLLLCGAKSSQQMDIKQAREMARNI